MGLAALLATGCSSAWRQDDVGSEAALEVAWFDGASTTWVGGSVGTLLRYDGLEWTPIDTGGLRSVRAIHGSSPNDVWVGGDDGFLFHYDGTAWREVDAPVGDGIDAIWAFAPDDVLVLTVTRVFRGSPGAWRELSFSGTYDLVWASSRNDIWLIQSLGDFVHYDGSTWQTVSNGLPGVQLWYDAFGVGSNLVVVGSDYGNGATWILQWNGTRWNAEHIDVVGDVQSSFGIDGTSLDDVWRVGSFGFAAHYDGATWRTHNIGDDLTVLEDVVVTNDEVIAVGDFGAIWRRPRAIE